MALVAFTPARLGSQEELRPFERLLAELSSAFAEPIRGHEDSAAGAAIDKLGSAFGFDECTLVRFSEHGSGSVVHSWAAPAGARLGDEDLDAMPWLMQQVLRHAVAALGPDRNLPQTARDDWAHAERAGIGSRLGVPLACSGRVAYALIAGCRQYADWRAPLVERLRLAGEIVAAGLERIRLEQAARATASERHPVPDAGANADMLYLQEEARNQAEADQLIGESGVFRGAVQRLTTVAPLDATVLLLGETGTGKELFARAVHDRSRRRARMLVRVNCAALPASLIESELFGHERGAFTGAIATRQGRFELADGGTIFLDEIGDLVPELQAKLLRVLQEGEFERVGSSKTRRVDARVIAATHVNLEEAVASGRFRADLYYRLSVFPINLPSLRQRREDIPQLVWFFIHRRQRDLRRRITRVPAAVMSALQGHDWPGNVRELENVIERALIRSTDGTLQLDDLPRCTPAARPSDEETDSLDALQRSHIERILRECGGRINGPGNAAIRLGIHPNTLRFRIKKLGVVMPARSAGGSDRAGCR
jgi:transcriptional regulator with GAF, ATPase, and Fis domain